MSEDLEVDPEAMKALIAGEELNEPEPAEQDPEQQEAEQDPVLQEAISKGYNPEGVEGKRHLSPEEFLERGQFYDQIHSLQKKVKKQEESLEALKEFNQTVREREREKVLNELKQQKLEALELGEHSKVIDIDEQIADAKQEFNEPPKQDEGEVFQNFLKNNPWYDATSDEFNEDKTTYAEVIGRRFQAQNPTKTAEDLLNYVEEKVKEKFKPTNPNRDKPAAVASSKPSSKKNFKYKLSDVDDPDVLKIANTLIRNGDVTEEQWLKSYFGE